MTRAEVVGVVGAGPFGTALANLVASTGREVVLLSSTREVVRKIQSERQNPDRLPGVKLAESLRATGDAGELARAARFIVLAVSSHDVRARLRALGDVLDGGHLLVHAIGALAAPDDIRVSQVVTAETPVRRVGALAGPALARDLAEERFCSMVAASQFDEVTAEARRLLNAPPVLRLYRGSDLIGVELAAALSGAHTVALGLADGLDTGPGTRAVLVTRVVAEAARLGEALGADAKTFSGLAGLGNLLVRASSAATERSADYQLGLALARGERVDGDLATATEGARATGAAIRLATRLGLHMPVLAALDAVLSGRVSLAHAAKALGETVGAAE